MAEANRLGANWPALAQALDTQLGIPVDSWDEVPDAPAAVLAQARRVLAPPPALRALEALGMLLGEELDQPPADWGPDTDLRLLIPPADRAQTWEELREASGLILPALQPPVWVQHLSGALLLASFVALFVWLPYGLLLPPLSIALAVLLDRRGREFYSPRAGVMAARIAALNPVFFPPEELGPTFSEGLWQLLRQHLPLSEQENWNSPWPS